MSLLRKPFPAADRTKDLDRRLDNFRTSTCILFSAFLDRTSDKRELGDLPVVSSSGSLAEPDSPGVFDADVRIRAFDLDGLESTFRAGR